MDMLPEAWYITTTEESNDVVCDWFNSQGHKFFDRSIGNHIGVSSRGVIGYMGSADPKKNFKGGVELTFEQFKKLVLKEEIKTMEHTFTVTREQLKRIHDIACSKWQTKIGELASSIGVFGDTLELTYTQVEEMFNAATSAQKPVLKEIFPDFKKDNIAIKRADSNIVADFSQDLFGNTLALQTLSAATPTDKLELADRALYLHENYRVEIGPTNENGNSGTYIAFYKK